MHKLLRIQEEKETVELMIRLYCRQKEGNKELCDSCKTLLKYAHERLSRCPFQENKKTCRLCSIHCYKPHLKKQMQVVMRYAGPRMIIYHPIAAIKHLWREFLWDPIYQTHKSIYRKNVFHTTTVEKVHTISSKFSKIPHCVIFVTFWFTSKNKMP